MSNSMDTEKFIIQPRKAYQNDDEYLEGKRAAIRQVIQFVGILPRDKPWVIEIKRLIKERSNPQNAALWGCAYKFLSTETGNDPEDLHTYFCGEHFGWKLEHVMGTQKRKPIRTTTADENGKRDVISTEALSDFYDFIQRRSAETIGLQVPDPDPDWKKRMKDGKD